MALLKWMIQQCRSNNDKKRVVAHTLFFMAVLKLNVVINRFQLLVGVQDEDSCGKARQVRLVQLRGLEARVISQLVQEGKERLRGRFALCHPPLTKALPLF
jgi:hypothetical protein